ncbi:MAG: hydrogenase-4 component E [Deltaproteobacteria bacterium]|nr:hydrogenase-4 component E [Deltaproteobacteria bacterium]
MNALIEFVIILLLLNNFALLSTAAMKTRIRLLAFEGVLLALLPLLMAEGLNFAYALLFSLAVFAIKGLCFPWMLGRTLHRVISEPRLPPRIGYNLSILTGILALVFSLWLESRLPIAHGFFPFLLFPAAFSTIFSGFVLIAGRMKAITQVIGYLVVENGVFLLALPLMSSDGGFLFEMVILLDVLVAVFVMGIAIHHISDAFETIAVGRFCALKD